MSRTRQIQRVRISQPSLDFVESEGGQHAWVWAVPLPYRAIASPWAAPVMPDAPNNVEAGDGWFEHRLGYYATLQSFLTYSFGWTRPDKGLLWWITDGKPRVDSRFALIADTWDADGTLIGYLAWLSTRGGVGMAEETLGQWAGETDQSELDLDTTWARQIRTALDSDPWNSGSDPFHLGAGWHISAPSRSSGLWETTGADDPPKSARLVAINDVSRTATFVCDTVLGWYLGLTLLANELPPLARERNWSVDVFVRPIGFMGTYRRSRATGLWFAGQHRYHAVGN